MTLPPIEPVFQEVGSILYFSKEERGEGVPFYKRTDQVAGAVFFEGKNDAGQKKIWAVQRDHLLQWAKQHHYEALEVNRVYSLISQIKQKEDDIFEPKGHEERLAILGFDPESKEGKLLIEVACIISGKLLETLSKYPLTTKEGKWARFEFAKIAAAKNGWRTSEFIQKYGFDAKTEVGQKMLFEVAKIAAAQSGGGTSFFIQNYGFDAKTEVGQKLLFEIAKVAAAKSGWRTSEFIQNYGFDVKTEIGQKMLFVIAMIAAAQNGNETSQFIQNYGFNAETEAGRKMLFDIAKIAAAQSGHGTSLYIEKYGFDVEKEAGRKMLFEIAKIAAAQDGERTSCCIKYYGFDVETEVGQKMLFEIAKIAAAQNGGGTSHYIRWYGFDAKTEVGRMMLFVIALIAAAQNGKETSRYIQNYGFDARTEAGRKILFEIATTAVEQDGVRSSASIQNYGFDVKTEKGKQTLLEVLETSARGNLYLMPDMALNYGIQDARDLKKPLQMVILRKLENQDTHSELKSWLVQLVGGFPEIGRFYYFREQCPLEPFALSKYLFECLKVDEKTKEWFEKRLKRTKEPFDQKRLVNWMTLLALFQFVSPDVDLFNGKSLWFLEEIEKRDPKLRGLLTGQLILTAMEGRLESLKQELGDETKERPLRLIRLVLKNYPKEAENPCKEAIESFKESKKRIALKEGGRQKLILETLLLISNTSLRPLDKSHLIEFFSRLSLERLSQVASLVKDIILYGGEKDLKGANDVERLRAILEKCFNKTCQVKVEEFNIKYEKTIGTWRQKEAISTYVAGLKTLKDEGKAIHLFQEFLTSVLKNTFEEKRLSLENNPHLKLINEKHPEVFAKWNAPIELDSSEMSVAEDTTGVHDKIYNQLKMAIDNGHLGDEIKIKYAFITKETAKEAQKDLENKLSEKEISNAERSSLAIEKALLQLISLENPDEIKKALEGLKSRDLKNDVFKEDLKACESFLKDEFERKALKVVDSTDPNHFLLMGTEVLGSCQRVGGGPKQNRGLLGYMLDGKHRLFLVLDETGKIVARSVARLLVDEKEQPVLFLERLYVADNNSKYAPLIEKLAKKKASSMQVPLVAALRSEESRPYPTKIKALRGNVPFEYVDALSGMETTPYEIPKVMEVIEKL